MMPGNPWDLWRRRASNTGGYPGQVLTPCPPGEEGHRWRHRPLSPRDQLRWRPPVFCAQTLPLAHPFGTRPPNSGRISPVLCLLPAVQYRRRPTLSSSASSSSSWPRGHLPASPSPPQITPHYPGLSALAEVGPAVASPLPLSKPLPRQPTLPSRSGGEPAVPRPPPPALSPLPPPPLQSHLRVTLDHQHPPPPTPHVHTRVRAQTLDVEQWTRGSSERVNEPSSKIRKTTSLLHPPSTTARKLSLQLGFLAGRIHSPTPLSSIQSFTHVPCPQIHSGLPPLVEDAGRGGVRGGGVTCCPSRSTFSPS